MKHFKAIAAMSLNRVIGAGNAIPWHLPEDFKWFKQKTIGKVVLMGRKTYESLGRPLPNRINVVLTRNPKLLKDDPERNHIYRGAKVGAAAMGVIKGDSQLGFDRLAPTELALVSDLSVLTPDKFGGAEVFVIGGAMTYEATLNKITDLYLTVVKRELEGDAFFPKFEDAFELAEEIRDTPEFKILRYKARES